MSVFTQKRLLLSVVAVILTATSAHAAHPSPRAHARMAFEADQDRIVLFGGESAVDGATLVSYDSDETWVFGGAHWKQLFPVTSPPARTAHGMTYDSINSRVVLFGGRLARTTAEGEIGFLNDTWIWDADNWTQIHTPNAPEARHLPAMTFDSVRNRVVLFGGSHYNADRSGFQGIYDTWEFDGTTWTKIDIATEPKVNSPLLAYDVKRNQVILVGTDDSVATLMYAYDPAARVWNKLTPEKLPACVFDGSMTYRSRTQTIVVTGGVCSITTPAVDSTWEWNGTNWTEITTTADRATATAIAYDPIRDNVVLFGGLQAFTTVPNSFTGLFQSDDTWRFLFLGVRPSPRSLSTFSTDPATKTIWLFGGLNEFSTAFTLDLWGYRDGQWFSWVKADSPADCVNPAAAYDTDRSKLVLTCAGSDTYEFDGATWKLHTPKNAPADRRFAAMVYDQTLKKVVLFGGFDGANYRNDTWTWDGTNWTEVKNNKPPNRALMAMWYDPLAKKTIMYGGLGRRNIDERITRFSDMYSFDGNGWTKMNVNTTPGERFGPQIAIDPRNNKLVLFGGLRSELDTATDVRRQFFDNDTWQWDGAASTWTLLHPARSPHARENGVMAWDPVANELVLFGGYAGLYFSDTWVFDGGNWRPRGEGISRRRPVDSGPRLPQAPSFGSPGNQ